MLEQDESFNSKNRPIPLRLLIIRGIFLALVYLTLTPEDDTSLYNIFVFAGKYVLFMMSARFVVMDPKIITTAFVTKAIFPLIENHATVRN